KLPPLLLRSSPCLLLVSPHRRRADASWVRNLVPEADRRLGPAMFISHRTEAGRAQQEVPARPRFEPEPARGEHSEEMSARKEQHANAHRPPPARPAARA